MQVYRESKDLYDLFKTCRACLNEQLSGTMVDILSSGEWEKNLLCIYSGLVDSEVVKSEYPFLICRQCQEKLLQTHALQYQSRTSSAAIEKYLIEKADVIVKEENIIKYESEEEEKTTDNNVDSDVGEEGDEESDGKSKLTQFSKVKGIDARRKCQFCNETFLSMIKLTTHEATHTRVKTFSCDVCNKKFTTEPALKIHMTLHTGKLMTCDFCDKRYSAKSELRMHIRKHSGEKPYQCTECGKAFVRNSNLKLHMRMHSTVRSFQCSQCSSTFKTKDSLNKHNEIHSVDSKKKQHFIALQENEEKIAIEKELKVGHNKNSIGVEINVIRNTLNNIVANITTKEEVEAMKRLLAPFAPTLDALKQRNSGTVLPALENLTPDNKKIEPEKS